MARRALVVILGAGFVYRLLFFAKAQLRTDELLQALVVRSGSAAAMLDRLRGGIMLPTPLNPLIQRGVVALAGESAWSLRLHAVVLGTLSVWLCYRVARFLFGESVALYSAALFALYPLHHHYSQEAMPYALSTFLALLSFDLLLRLVSGAHRGWRWWLGWTAVEVLLLFSSVAGVAILISQGGALLLSCPWRNKARIGRNQGDTGQAMRDIPCADLKVTVAFAGCAALSCVLIWFWAHFAWAGHTLGYTENLSFRLFRRILKELGDGSYTVTGLLTAGIGIGVSAMRRHGRTAPLPWLAAWFFLPPGVIYLLDRWAGGPLPIGQLLPCTPPLLLAAGYGISYVGERLTILDQLPSRVSSPALVYAAALAMASVATAHSHWRRTQIDWQGTAQYLQRTLQPGDTLVVPTGLQLLEYYVPQLSEFSPEESPSVSGLVTGDRSGRRIVVCLDALKPDPCAPIRTEAKGGRSWKVREFAGLAVFDHE